MNNWPSAGPHHFRYLTISCYRAHAWFAFVIWWEDYLLELTNFQRRWWMTFHILIILFTSSSSLVRLLKYLKPKPFRFDISHSHISHFQNWEIFAPLLIIEALFSFHGLFFSGISVLFRFLMYFSTKLEVIWLENHTNVAFVSQSIEVLSFLCKKKPLRNVKAHKFLLLLGKWEQISHAALWLAFKRPSIQYIFRFRFSE